MNTLVSRLVGIATVVLASAVFAAPASAGIVVGNPAFRDISDGLSNTLISDGLSNTVIIDGLANTFVCDGADGYVCNGMDGYICNGAPGKDAARSGDRQIIECFDPETAALIAVAIIARVDGSDDLEPSKVVIIAAVTARVVPHTIALVGFGSFSHSDTAFEMGDHHYVVAR